MFKSLFISLNLVGLILIPFIYVQEVSISCDATDQMDVNENSEVTITINKGGITGPARLKLDFTNASGIIAEEISSGGASFSFNEDNAMFVWYDIPGDETIKLNFSIQASPGSEGAKTITGSFSYLDEEERKTMDIPEIKLVVNSGSSTASEATNVSSPPQSGLPNVSGTRTIEELNDGFLVTVNISKEDGSGFARLKEQIPPGFNVIKENTSGGVFKFVDNTVKFLWTSIKAEQPNIEVSYKLIPTTASAGDFSLSGSFSGEFLIVDDKPQKVEIPATTFTYQGNMASNNTNNGSNENGNDGGNENGNNGGNENGNNGGNENGNDGGNENGNDGGNTTITTHSPTGITGISYRVQVLAAHKTVDGKYIKKRYNGYNKQLNLENHEGWVKYTTNGMDTYKKARDHRESLGKYDFPGPFVTAYNDGNRITVQEALMTSQQTWVQ